eukprot:TRINITY_DN74092_c0_g1_i1.p1 TRINITY_DN74092_c0_g1~~TRINITY_DN74092_c0_g1_i1.p1  ORF type:complete len:296 (-),score=37.42 TRINITY_DN74092_c0_g1_i1:59-946(-)
MPRFSPNQVHNFWQERVGKDLNTVLASNGLSARGSTAASCDSTYGHRNNPHGVSEAWSEVESFDGSSVKDNLPSGAMSVPTDANDGVGFPRSRLYSREKLLETARSQQNSVEAVRPIRRCRQAPCGFPNLWGDEQQSHVEYDQASKNGLFRRSPRHPDRLTLEEVRQASSPPPLSARGSSAVSTSGFNSAREWRRTTTSNRIHSTFPGVAAVAPAADKALWSPRSHRPQQKSARPKSVASSVATETSIVQTLRPPRGSRTGNISTMAVDLTNKTGKSSMPLHTSARVGDRKLFTK